MSDTSAHIRASRLHVPRSRGAFSGVLLLILGVWAGVVAFIGPYFNLAYTPAPNDAWHWTAGRGWLQVLPAAAVVAGALLLLLSANRVTTSFGGWLAVAGGVWLVVGPALADLLNISLGVPDPSSSTGVRALTALLFFYGVGVAIVLFAALALGRLSVHSLRDVKAAERRAEAEAERDAQAERDASMAEAGRHEAASGGPAPQFQPRPDSPQDAWNPERPQAQEGPPPQSVR